MKYLILISAIICASLATHAIGQEDVIDELAPSSSSSKASKPIGSSTLETPAHSKKLRRNHANTANTASSASAATEANAAHEVIAATAVTKVYEVHHSKEKGNLPSYAVRTQAVTEFGTPTMIPKNEDFDSLVELRKGDSLKAVISQDLVAYPGSKAPVIARVLEGKFKGALLLGEASMDPTTKRANVNFNTIRPLKSKASYNFTGELMAFDGIRGLDGEYESSYWTYFWAETLTNTVAGIADAATQKTPTAMGPYVTTPGLSNQFNQGAAIGLSRTAERLGDRVKTAPEITTVKGPIIVQITVLK